MITIHFRSICVLLLLFACSARAARPADPAPPLSDVWVVNTRSLPTTHSADGLCEEMAFERLHGNRFIRVTREEFLESLSPNVTTCFFVHGNRMNACDAKQVGLQVQRRLSFGKIPCRFVIWSWPSDKIPGPIRDARIKACRTDSESYYLASLLAVLPTDANVSLIGYSFGARAITGSLHLLGGGIVAGNTLNRQNEPSVKPRVTLFAAAMPQSWLHPAGRHGLAMFQVEQMTLLYNPIDPALKHYHVVFRPGHPQALGLRGISTRYFGTAGALLQQFNVRDSIGLSHSLSKYLDSASIMRVIRHSALSSSSL